MAQVAKMLFQHILATWYQQCQPCGQFLAQENRLKLSLRTNKEKHTPGSTASNGLCPMHFFFKKKNMVTYIYIYVYYIF